MANWLRAVIHILLGIVGLGSSLRAGGRGFCLFDGWLLPLVGVLYFVPVMTEFITAVLNLSVYA